jgi:hypothetical protein
LGYLLADAWQAVTFRGVGTRQSDLDDDGDSARRVAGSLRSFFLVCGHRRLLVALAAGFFTAVPAAYATSKLIPQPEWLVPESSLIVVARVAEIHRLDGSQYLRESGGSPTPAMVVTVKLAKLEVRQTVLGIAPPAPLVIDIDLGLTGLFDLATDGEFLLFLRPFDKRGLVYEIVESLRVREGRVSWHPASEVGPLVQAPLAEVVTELQAYAKTVRSMKTWKDRERQRAGAPGGKANAGDESKE